MSVDDSVEKQTPAHRRGSDGGSGVWGIAIGLLFITWGVVLASHHYDYLQMVNLRNVFPLFFIYAGVGGLIKSAFSSEYNTVKASIIMLAIGTGWILTELGYDLEGVAAAFIFLILGIGLIVKSLT
ncbi:MAG: hypothetical protein ABEK59_11920 [Halobacteria archaeon]